MFSDAIKAALEKEVVGQPFAVNTVVRGLTRLVSGLTPREHSMCAQMFIGPPGTGKSHLVRTLARLLHGDERRLVIVDCGQLSGTDPLLAFTAQLAPLFPPAMPSMPGMPAIPGNPWPPVQDVMGQAPPLAVIKVELLERASAEICKVLASILESGMMALPDGRKLNLRHSMLFVTSRLCSQEILDEAPRIGFSGALDEDDSESQDQLYDLCYDKAQQRFGTDVVERFDRLVIFHKIQEEHMPAILDRYVERLDQWLAARCLRCNLQPAAREFLVAKGGRDLRAGARELLRAHRQFVEFPIADMLVTGRIPAGGSIRIDRRPKEDHLHFTVDEPADKGVEASAPTCEIPVG
jgi:ATP-dependent Clp protease ATP-binding subunit ClpA